MNYAIIKLKKPELAIELNDLLKKKYRIQKETFNDSGSFFLELNDNIIESNKSIIIALIKFSRTKSFNHYISVVKSENFEELFKIKEKLN